MEQNKDSKINLYKSGKVDFWWRCKNNYVEKE